MDLHLTERKINWLKCNYPGFNHLLKPNEQDVDGNSS